MNVLRGIAALSTALLAACGRDDGRTAEPPPVLPTYAGVVASGFTIGSGSVQVASNGTFPRSRLLPADGRFSAPLAGLTPPYLIVADPRPDSSVAAADALAVTRASSGTINVTPLTRLVALELIRQEPLSYFSRLLTDAGIPLSARIADFSPFTPEATASAQATVIRLLRQELGIVVPATIADSDWVTTPFTQTAGDPMHDTLAAFSARYARDEFVPDSYPRNRVAELARCAREQVDIQIGSEFYAFCPVSRDALPDPDDPALLVFRLFDARGNTLRLQLRGSAVTGIELRRSPLPLFSCTEAACSQVTVGGQISDRTRPLSFAGTTLSGTDGSTAVLTGTVIGGVPGRPAIDCDDVEGLPLFVTAADGSATAQCAAAAVRFEAVAGSRYVYQSIPDGVVPEVRVDGDRLLSITLFRQDENDLALRPLFECSGDGCDGTVLGPFVDSGLTNTERRLSLAGTVLPSLDGGSPVILDGAILLGNRIDRMPPDCSRFPATQTVRVRVGDEADRWDLCPPYDVGEGTVGGFVIRASNIGQFPGAQLGDYVYSFANDQARSESQLSLVTSPAGVPRRLDYRRSTETFACIDTACLSAVTIGPADARSAHVLTIAPVTVPEVVLGDRPGDRSVSLHGQLLTAPDRSFVE
ncbi:MAG: hypothetical protein C0434_14955 [Xanthomonadaceae bacterium]|nr:hypothetical protein [Xanthomonadaceae bacterium]